MQGFRGGLWRDVEKRLQGYLTHSSSDQPIGAPIRPPLASHKLIAGQKLPVPWTYS